MQPLLTQVPPKCLRSMIATLSPACDRRLASEGPAWPGPMMAGSKCWTMARSSASDDPRRRDHAVVGPNANDGTLVRRPIVFAHDFESRGPLLAAPGAIAFVYPIQSASILATPPASVVICRHRTPRRRRHY